MSLHNAQDRTLNRHVSSHFLPVVQAVEYIAGVRFWNQLPPLCCRVRIGPNDVLLRISEDQDRLENTVIYYRSCIGMERLALLAGVQWILGDVQFPKSPWTLRQTIKDLGCCNDGIRDTASRSTMAVRCD